MICQIGSKNALIDEKTANVQGNVGENVGEKEREIIEIIALSPSISAKNIAQKMGMTSRQVERLLFQLKAKRLIERVGPDKGGHWKVSK